MKVLTTIPSISLLFSLERYMSHAFTISLKNIIYKTFYSLISFGFRLAYLQRIQKNTLEIKCLHNSYAKEIGLVCTNTQRKTLQKIHQLPANPNGYRVQHGQ
jgi:hypothetical protein